MHKSVKTVKQVNISWKVNVDGDDRQRLIQITKGKNEDIHL